MAEEIKEFTEMTKAGYNEKVKELNFRKNEERNRISEQIKYAKSLGDFSENAELDAAKDKDNDKDYRDKGPVDRIHKYFIIYSHSYGKTGFFAFWKT